MPSKRFSLPKPNQVGSISGTSSRHPPFCFPYCMPKADRQAGFSFQPAGYCLNVSIVRPWSNLNDKIKPPLLLLASGHLFPRWRVHCAASWATSCRDSFGSACVKSCMLRNMVRRELPAEMLVSTPYSGFSERKVASSRYLVLATFSHFWLLADFSTASQTCWVSSASRKVGPAGWPVSSPFRKSAT